MSRLKRLMPTMSSWRASAQKHKEVLELPAPEGAVDIPNVNLYQPLLSENHIRLLLLEPLAPSSTRISQPICTTLHQVVLDPESLSTRPYKALSYEWVVREKENGDELDVHEEQNVVNPTILLDGHAVHIGENLYNALKSIRHLKGEIGGSDLWLWVDALCINQSDVQERGHQVRLMKRIYETAEMVLVWLGMGNDLTHLATKVLNLEADELQDRVAREMLERDELHGIQQICEMGYWRRVWILQEVVLARNYMVICNQDFVPMNRFERALAPLCKHTWKTKLRELVLWLPESPAQEIMTLRSSRGIASSLIEWVRICVRCRFGATDPRDYVYALLGISDDCEGKIEPDYSRSAREVYSSAVAVIANKAEGYNEILCGSFAELMGLRWDVGRAVWEEVCGRKDVCSHTQTPVQSWRMCACAHTHDFLAKRTIDKISFAYISTKRRDERKRTQTSELAYLRLLR